MVLNQWNITQAIKLLREKGCCVSRKGFVRYRFISRLARQDHRAVHTTLVDVPGYKLFIDLANTIEISGTLETCQTHSVSGYSDKTVVVLSSQ